MLDEPTIGLHPRDTGRLLDILTSLKARDNSVLVVEHDAETMRRADWIVDLGPGAGRQGGSIVNQGTFTELLAGSSATSEFLWGPDSSNDRERNMKSAIRGHQRFSSPIVLERIFVTAI